MTAARGRGGGRPSASPALGAAAGPGSLSSRTMTESAPGPASHTYFCQRLRLHYVDWGNADKPSLLLIHGGRDHCRNWDWTAAALRNDWHVIAPDLRGHGDSQWSDRKSTRLNSSHLGISYAVLCLKKKNDD